jgi:hypothetical protein
MLLLLIVSVFYGAAGAGFGHVLRVRVPTTFTYFPGSVQGALTMHYDPEPMVRNVLIATSTASQFFYDVYIAWMPDTPGIRLYTSIPLARRCEQWVGRYTMLQLLFVLLPILDALNDDWEESYVFPRNYVGETGASVRMRHSSFINIWVGRVITSVQNGYAFHKHFWEVVAPPVTYPWGVLNHGAYPITERKLHAGAIELLWPSCVGDGLLATMEMMWADSRITSIPVPYAFMQMLERAYRPHFP